MLAINRTVCFFVVFFLHLGHSFSLLIIAITIFSNLIGALITHSFTNYCVGLKSDSEIGQLAVIGYLKSDSYISQSY